MALVKTFTFDQESVDHLEMLARFDEIGQSELVRRLIDQEWARRYSQPNPAITLGEAVQAGDKIQTEQSEPEKA